MGHLRTASSSVADDSKMTISMCFNLTEVSDVKLLSWSDGTETNVTSQINSFISIRPGTGTFITLRGRRNSISQTLDFSATPPNPFVGYVAEGGPALPTLAPPDPATIYATPKLSAEFDFSAYEASVWYHILASIDLSAGATLVANTGFPSPYKFRCTITVRVNGVDAAIGAPAMAAIADFNDPTTYYPFVDSDDGDGVMPVWPLSINGFDFRAPGLNTTGDGLPDPRKALRVADGQVWVGQAIDPAIHIEKFYSGGHPVNPSVAEEAFGQPTYRFQGPAASIANTGSNSDVFTKTGTVTDYTPGP